MTTEQSSIDEFCKRMANDLIVAWNSRPFGSSIRLSAIEAFRVCVAAGIQAERARCQGIADSLELCGQGISTAIEEGK